MNWRSFHLAVILTFQGPEEAFNQFKVYSHTNPHCVLFVDRSISREDLYSGRIVLRIDLKTAAACKLSPGSWDFTNLWLAPHQRRPEPIN